MSVASQGVETEQSLQSESAAMQPVFGGFGNSSVTTKKTTFDQYPIYEVAKQQ
jgi:hypothetical protein